MAKRAAAAELNVSSAEPINRSPVFAAKRPSEKLTREFKFNAIGPPRLAFEVSLSWTVTPAVTGPKVSRGAPNWGWVGGTPSVIVRTVPAGAPSVQGSVTNPNAPPLARLYEAHPAALRAT